MQIAKRGWVGVLAAVLVAGCGSDSDPQPPPPPPAAVLDWEGTQFANWDAAGNLQTGTQALTFSQDTAVFHGGAASLKVAGTLIDNQWGTDWIADAKIFLREDDSAVDFSSRTLTAYVRLGTGTGDVDTAQIQLVDSSGDGCQDKYTPTAGADTNGWLQMTFTPSNTAEINYCSPSFDITDVRSVVVRISKPTEGDQAIDFNIDDISW